MTSYSHRDDLGPGIPSVAAFLTILFFAYVVRQKWRLAVERKEEIERLVTYASQEAARADFEYRLVYSNELENTGGLSFCGYSNDGVSVSGGDRFVRACAVCYSPTTTRCSRCKAVRYCSGKCQVIHWRQGHKDKCRTKTTDNKDYTPGVLHDLNVASATKNNCYDNGSENIVTNHEEESMKNDTVAYLDVTEGRNHGHRPDVDRNIPLPPVLSSIFSTQVFDTSTASVKHDGLDTTECSSRSSTETTSATSSKTVKHFESVHAKSPLCEISAEFIHVNSSMDKLNQLAAGFSVEVPSYESYGDRDSLGIGNLDNVPISVPHDGRFDLSTKKYNKKDAIPQKDPMLIPFFAIPTQSCSGKESGDKVNLPEFKDLSERTESEILQKTRGSNVSPDCQENSVPVGKCMTISRHPIISPTGTTTSNGGHAVKSSVENDEQLKSSKSSKPKKSHPLYDLYLKLYNEKVHLQPHGLVNCGNSCYANAVLQCLTFTRPLTAYFLLGLHSKKCSKKEWCFSCELQNLIVRADQGESLLSPFGILSHVNNLSNSLGHGKEEDAHEFLRCAIEAMQRDCVVKSVKSKAVHSDEVTLMQLIFGGYLRSKITCLRCQSTSERCEKMLDLTIEMGYDDIQTLEQALARFTNYELLDGENKYKCNRCRSYEKAKKRLTVFEAPNVLTIALKRFQSGKIGKLNKTIHFPEILNMTKYMSSVSNDKSPVYCLYAVVVHVDLMFSGHYICYVKNTNGKWYEIDDSVVKPVELENVLSKGAYMLLYSRITPHCPRSMCDTLQLRVTPDETFDSLTNPNPDFHDGFFFPQHPYASSESSSLTSLSDDSSVGTESTRDSTSADEYSDFVLGELGYQSSPSKISEETDDRITRRRQNEMNITSNSYSCSDLSSLGEEEVHQSRVISYGNASGTNRVENRHVVKGKGSSVLPPDTTKQGKKLTEHRRSSSSGIIGRTTTLLNNIPFRKSGLFTRKTTR